MSRTKVLVVDDSALVRSLLGSIINAQADMQCVGAASDPLVAREMIRNLNPDVLTLDVEMPRMDGIDFLEKLMRLRPMPVVMVSTLTQRGAETTLRALELGAVDFVAKPKIGISQGLQEATAEIIDKIRIAARARIARQGASPRPASHAPAPSQAPAHTAPRATMPLRHGTEKLIAIGSSTGGTEAVRVVLTQLPADCPAVVITQHMPPGFTKSFADRLDTLCRIRVKEAENGERLLPGHAYIAPGGHHLRVERSGANYLAVIDAGEPINRHRPSVEALFDSVALKAGPNAVGVMLTGMGRDGADAMRRMHDAGAWNIAQDESSCVVFGMPREAILAGGVDEVVSLAAIGPRVLERLRTTGGLSNRV